jgi:hypothetical protein
MEAVFTGIGRKFISVILSEENHENLRGFTGSCVHCHLQIVYNGNSI